MKVKHVFATLGIPLLIGGAIVFHPGTAAAQFTTRQETPFAMATGAFTVDPVHSSIGFEVRHLGLAVVHGRFNSKSGKLMVDRNDLTKSSVEFNIEASSIDTNVPPRDTHLRSADFFEVEKYPNITFKSTRIRANGSGYLADGNLTIKAVTRKVTIPFKYYGPITDPMSKTRIGVMASPITINRQDYGVAYNQKLPDGTPSVGNEVKIHLSLEATLDK